MTLGCIAEREALNEPQWLDWLHALSKTGRATRLAIAQDDALWVSAERVNCVRAIYPQARCEPALEPPAEYDEPWTEEAALVEVVRAQNPRIRFADGARRGYGLVELTAREAHVAFRGVADARATTSSVSDLARFVVESGRPGVQAA